MIRTPILLLPQRFPASTFMTPPHRYIGFKCDAKDTDSSRASHCAVERRARKPRVWVKFVAPCRKCDFARKTAVPNLLAPWEAVGVPRIRLIYMLGKSFRTWAACLSTVLPSLHPE